MKEEMTDSGLFLDR